MSDTGDNELTEAEAQALLDRLEQAIDDTDAVPPWLTRFANESHRLVSFEGELAEILADSILLEPTMMRAVDEVRTIEFGAGRVVVRLEIDGIQIRGSSDPAASSMALISEIGETTAIDVNQRGFFTFPVPDAAFRLNAVVKNQEIRTDWVRLR